MPTNPIAIKIDAAQLLASLKDADAQLGNTGEELVLDFSAVQRIDAAALSLIEQLVREAQQKHIKLVLTGVNVDVYKVLKLVKLTTNITVSRM